MNKDNVDTVITLIIVNLFATCLTMIFITLTDYRIHIKLKELKQQISEVKNNDK